MQQTINNLSLPFLRKYTLKNYIYRLLISLSFIISFFANAAQNANEHYENALISFQQNEITTSIIHIRNALKTDENHMPSRVLFAQIHLAQGDGVAAEVELQKTKSNEVDQSQIVTLFAHAYILQNKYEDVLRITKAGERGSLIESELLLYRGQALIGKKLYRSADTAFEEALLLNPSYQLALLGRAQMALKALKPEKAMAYIEQSLKIPTPFINGWILKANVLQKLGQIDKALITIKQALAIDDTHLAARLSAASLHIVLKNYEIAEKHVDYIINKIPNEPRAGYLKAIINASLNKENTNKENTLSDVLITLSAVPDEVMKNTPDYYYLAGLTNFQFGNLNDARKYLTQYLAYAEFDLESVRMITTIDLRQGNAKAAKNLLTKTNLARPNDANILTLLGMVHLQLHQTQKAESYFLRVLTMFPNSEIGISNLAQSKMQSGEYQSAIDALLSIKDNKINGVQIKLLLIDSYQKSNNPEKALIIAKELSEQFSKDSYFQQRLGVIYGLNGNIPEARSAFQNALTIDPKNIIAIVHLARMDNIENNTDKALTFLKEKLEIYPDNDLIKAELSDTYLIRGDIQNALLWIKKAYAGSPNSFYVVRKQAELLSKNNQIQIAIDSVDSFIGQNIKEIEALRLIATLYQSVGKHHPAILALRDYVKKSHDKTSAYIFLAKAQQKANDRIGTIQSYKKAIVADETSLPAHIGLLNIVSSNKDEKYATLLINSIYKITKNDGLKDMLLGDLYLALEQPEKSIQHYTATLKVSDQKQAILGLYRSYKLKEEFIPVIPHLKKWLIKYPGDLLVAISYADALKGAQQLQASADYYEELLTSHGQLPILLNNAANVYFELNNQEKSLEYARGAYKYLSDNVAIMDTLAWIESRSGNHEEALGLFRKALTKDYDNAEIKYHIAATLDALDRRIEAKKYLMEAINSNQDFSEKKQARKLLDTWL